MLETPEHRPNLPRNTAALSERCHFQQSCVFLASYDIISLCVVRSLIVHHASLMGEQLSWCRHRPLFYNLVTFQTQISRSSLFQSYCISLHKTKQLIERQQKCQLCPTTGERSEGEEARSWVGGRIETEKGTRADENKNRVKPTIFICPLQTLLASIQKIFALSQRNIRNNSKHAWQEI